MLIVSRRAYMSCCWESDLNELREKSCLIIQECWDDYEEI